MLTALGDADDQLEVYFDAAVRHGATDAEIADVITLALACVGAPRAVNAAEYATGPKMINTVTVLIGFCERHRPRLAG